jgi:hypothetical protein
MERFAARAIVLLMSAVGQVFEPDRPHESLHVLGRVRGQRHWSRAYAGVVVSLDIVC